MPKWYQRLNLLFYPPTAEVQLEEVPEPDAASDLYINLLIRRIDHVFGQVDAIDAKVSTWFATASSLLPVTLALLAIVKEDDQSLTTIGLFATFCAAAAYLGLVACFFAGYKLRKWKNPPSLNDWRAQFAHPQRHSDDKIRAMLGTTLMQDIRANESILEHKVFYAQRVFLLLFVEVICLTSTAAAPLLSFF